MTKARENSDYTGLAADIAAGDTAARAGRKNLIINGGMQVSQRKDVDSAAISTSINTYDIDRFLSSIATVSATSQRLLDQAVNGKVVNTFKQVATSSGTGRLGQIQKFELLPKGEAITLSVWVRSNTANAHLFHYDNTTLIASSPHTGGGNWEKLTITTTLDVDKSSTEALLRVSTSTNSNIAITSGDYIESAMWQLELGSVATDFEHRSYGEILADCQRYYSETGVSIQGYQGAGNYASESLNWPQTMRAAPSVSLVSGPQQSNITSTGAHNVTASGCRVEIRASGAGRAFHLGAISKADAEL